MMNPNFYVPSPVSGTTNDRQVIHTLRSAHALTALLSMRNNSNENEFYTDSTTTAPPTIPTRQQNQRKSSPPRQKIQRQEESSPPFTFSPPQRQKQNIQQKEKHVDAVGSYHDGYVHSREDFGDFLLRQERLERIKKEIEDAIIQDSSSSSSSSSSSHEDDQDEEFWKFLPPSRRPQPKTKIVSPTIFDSDDEEKEKRKQNIFNREFSLSPPTTVISQRKVDLPEEKTTRSKQEVGIQCSSYSSFSSTKTTNTILTSSDLESKEKELQQISQRFSKLEESLKFQEYFQSAVESLHDSQDDLLSQKIQSFCLEFEHLQKDLLHLQQEKIQQHHQEESEKNQLVSLLHQHETERIQIEQDEEKEFFQNVLLDDLNEKLSRSIFENEILSKNAESLVAHASRDQQSRDAEIEQQQEQISQLEESLKHSKLSEIENLESNSRHLHETEQQLLFALIQQEEKHEFEINSERADSRQQLENQKEQHEKELEEIRLNEIISKRFHQQHVDEIFQKEHEARVEIISDAFAVASSTTEFFSTPPESIFDNFHSTAAAIIIEAQREITAEELRKQGDEYVAWIENALKENNDQHQAEIDKLIQEGAIEQQTMREEFVVSTFFQTEATRRQRILAEEQAEFLNRFFSTILDVLDHVEKERRTQEEYWKNEVENILKNQQQKHQQEHDHLVREFEAREQQFGDIIQRQQSMIEQLREQHRQEKETLEANHATTISEIQNQLFLVRDVELIEMEERNLILMNEEEEDKFGFQDLISSLISHQQHSRRRDDFQQVSRSAEMREQVQKEDFALVKKLFVSQNVLNQESEKRSRIIQEESADFVSILFEFSSSRPMKRNSSQRNSTRIKCDMITFRKLFVTENLLKREVEKRLEIVLEETHQRQEEISVKFIQEILLENFLYAKHFNKNQDNNNRSKSKKIINEGEDEDQNYFVDDAHHSNLKFLHEQLAKMFSQNENNNNTEENESDNYEIDISRSRFQNEEEMLLQEINEKLKELNGKSTTNSDEESDDDDEQNLMILQQLHSTREAKKEEDERNNTQDRFGFATASFTHVEISERNATEIEELIDLKKLALLWTEMNSVSASSKEEFADQHEEELDELEEKTEEVEVETAKNQNIDEAQSNAQRDYILLLQYRQHQQQQNQLQEIEQKQRNDQIRLAETDSRTSLFRFFINDLLGSFSSLI